MTKQRLLITAVAIVILIPVLVLAQASRNTKGAVDKQQIARDRREVEEFERMLREMDTLRAARAAESFTRINTRIRTAMDRELEQARAQAAQAGRELSQRRSERRGELQEAGAAARADRMDAILSSSDAMQVAVRNRNADAIAENRRLMGEFLEVLRADLAANSSELSEDRKERGEDRRK